MCLFLSHRWQLCEAKQLLSTAQKLCWAARGDTIWQVPRAQDRCSPIRDHSWFVMSSKDGEKNMEIVDAHRCVWFLPSLSSSRSNYRSLFQEGKLG